MVELVDSTLKVTDRTTKLKDSPSNRRIEQTLLYPYFLGIGNEMVVPCPTTLFIVSSALNNCFRR